MGAGVTSASVGNHDEFVGLRDYRAGDPLRHIHWRSWARLGRPVVKEYEDENLPRYALVLDTALPAGADQELFEEAVSVAASFVAAVETRESMLDLLFVADQAYEFSMGGPGASRAADKMLEVLATVDVAAQASALEALETSVLRRSAHLSAAILVFLDWEDARRQMTQRLRARQVRCLCLVMTAAGKKGASREGAHFLRVGEVGADLARLQDFTVSSC